MFTHSHAEAYFVTQPLWYIGAHIHALYGLYDRCIVYVCVVERVCVCARLPMHNNNNVKKCQNQLAGTYTRKRTDAEHDIAVRAQRI